VQAIGERGKRSMKKKIKYSDLPPGGEPVGELEIIEDFLPPPGKLVFKQDNVKVTMSLSRKSVDFFKRHAAKHHTQYQKMIRNLLDQYVARQEKR
jgi:hypothetical protein